MATNIDENDVLDGEALNELYKWIDAVPLTRPKKNIARDFSDGVCVSEIIHHYLPRAIDLHNYVIASSTGQKRINWNTLNRKVFARLNMKLTDSTLAQVVDAKPGAIEQILWDLRRKIQENSTNSTTSVNGGLTFSQSAVRMSSHHSIKTIVAPKSKGTVLTTRNSRVQVTPPSRPITQWSSNPCPTTPRPLSGKKSGHPLPPPASPRRTQTPSAAPYPRLSKVVGSHPHPPSSVKPSLATVDERESIPPPPVQQQMSFGDLIEIPSQIVFRGHKMVAVELLESKDKEMKELENSKKQLTIKVDRLQKLVHIKDERIEDLGHQLNNLRSMYETATSCMDIAKSTKTDDKPENNNSS